MTTPSNARPRYRTGSQGNFALETVTTTTKRLPNRVVLHALQKWGKTSFAAQAPSPIFLMTRGEDGLCTLIDSGQLPEVPHFPRPFDGWLDLKCALHELNTKPHTYKTIVLDTLNGAERLCFEYLVETQMDGSWEKFDAYGRGPKLAVAEIIEFTRLLDNLREKGLSILALCHSQVRTFKNPEGLDYDRWEPVLAKETWGHIDRWADMILFGNFETFAESKEARATKAKARGGQQRVLCCERTAAYDAGNRHGLPPEIECGSSAAEAWAAFIQALKAGPAGGGRVRASTEK
jgi:hypothetical protein